jgi:hypothetical protein
MILHRWFRGSEIVSFFGVVLQEGDTEIPNVQIKVMNSNPCKLPYSIVH